MSLRPMLPLWALLPAFLPLFGLAGYLLVRKRRGPDTSRWAALRLATATLLLLVIGLRPSIHEDAGEMRQLDIDVVFAVDVTISMGAEDYAAEGTRLDGVRLDIESMIHELPGARFSLVTYGALVRTEVPFTTDANAVLSAAQVLPYEFNHTSIGTSLAPVVEPMSQLLARADETHPTRTRIVILMGDGEETVADAAPFDFSGLADQIGGGMVLGYGTEQGGKMRSRQLSFGDEQNYGSYLRDPATGEDAISRIDEGNLRTIADQLGVEYTHRSEPGTVPGIEAMLDGASEVAAEQHHEATALRDIHWWFAIPLMGIALIEVLLAGRRLADVPRIPRRSRP